MRWEPGKEYKIRDGHRARVYATDGGGMWNVHGAVYEDETGWRPVEWDEAGKAPASDGDDPTDLMPPEPHKQYVWMWARSEGANVSDMAKVEILPDGILRLVR